MGPGTRKLQAQAQQLQSSRPPPGRIIILKEQDGAHRVIFEQLYPEVQTAKWPNKEQEAPHLGTECEALQTEATKQ